MSNAFSSQFHLLFEQPFLGVAVTDLKTQKFIEVNSQFSKFIEYKPDEIIGKTPKDFTFQEDLNITDKFHHHFENEGVEFASYEKRYATKSGKIVWARVVVKEFEHENISTQKMLLAFVEDITAQKLFAEKAMRDELQLDTIFNCTSLGILCIDSNWNILISNKAIQQLLGYSDYELKAMTIRQLTHPDDLRETNNKLNPTQPGQSYYARRRYLRKEGSYITVRLGVTKFPENKFNFFAMATFEDISEQIKAEALIERQQVQLVGSSRMKALGEMSSGLAHEINNPVTIITSKVDRIISQIEKGNYSQDRLVEELGRIKESGYRIANIVRGLRSFSGDFEKDALMTVNCHQLFAEVLSLVSEKLELAGITMSLLVPSDLQIRCRSKHISQILMSLVMNSFDAVASLREKWIEIRSEIRDDKVKIYFTDSGTGIDKEVADKMWEPFFTTKDVGKGVGLGLSAALGIAKDHRGMLCLNQDCKNTQFILELPIK